MRRAITQGRRRRTSPQPSPQTPQTTPMPTRQAEDVPTIDMTGDAATRQRAARRATRQRARTRGSRCSNDAFAAKQKQIKKRQEKGEQNEF